MKEDENEAVQSRDFLDLHRQAPKIEGMASFWVWDKSQVEGEKDDSWPHRGSDDAEKNGEEETAQPQKIVSISAGGIRVCLYAIFSPILM